ncbi:MAG: hypothetical protein JST52_11240 [Bacteroidetes bacterium]|nr:hypothetical protein [Bacteroidota bacterium]MBS1739956.1 hypothetical protein [Bacteroidota bacterium]MBS1777602.1 hypothetical protein [Bacteroidota bacterium]
MKTITYIALTSILLSCHQQENPSKNWQTQIDSLQSTIKDSYKPGFGEFMSSIQVHHEKLWFAGINQNWKLATFEINEIKESISNIKKYCADRPEVQSLDMIEDPLSNISIAIEKKSMPNFKNGFTLLTSTCNSCHQTTNHGFNVITTPVTPPFSNQNFKVGIKSQ